jgi:hypothetical protein
MDWKDQDAVYAAVSAELDRAEKARCSEAWTTYWTERGWSFDEQRWIRQRPIEEIVRNLEQIAVADAEAGDPTWLFEWFLNPDRAEYRAALAPETWALMHDCALGMSPFLKRGRGSRPQSKEQRRSRTPIYDAIAQLPLIQRFLIGLFPGRTPREIRDRAQECVQHIFGLSAGAIANHLKRPRKRRQLPAT